jgi:hypothetical protein
MSAQTMTSNLLVRWCASQQLVALLILAQLRWKDAVRLASTCRELRKNLQWIVSQTPFDFETAVLHYSTPDILRIPIITGITPEKIRESYAYSFRTSCSRGRLSVAKWMDEKFELCSKNFFEDETKIKILFETFLRTCDNGNFDTAQWLSEKIEAMGYPMKDMFNQTYKYYFTQPFKMRKYKVGMWLVEILEMERVIDKQDVYNTLTYVCRDGNLQIAKWLVSKFKLDENDTRFMVKPMKEAAARGHWELVDWLMKDFNLKLRLCERDVTSIISEACIHGHLLIAKNFYEDFKTMPIFRNQDVFLSVFTTVSYFKHTDVERWMRHTFPICSGRNYDSECGV